MFFFNACSTHTKEFQALSIAIKDIKKPFSNKEIDSIEIVDYCYILDKKILEGYKIQRNIILNNKLKPSENFYSWIDKKESWILCDNEIDYMIKSISKQKKRFLNQQMFGNSNKKIMLVDLPSFEDNTYEDLDRQGRVKKEKFVYFLSKPIFNRNKNIFFIQYKTILLPNFSSTLIYKKKDFGWDLIAYMNHAM
jgi:hypothetical protein